MARIQFYVLFQNNKVINEPSYEYWSFFSTIAACNKSTLQAMRTVAMVNWPIGSLFSSIVPEEKENSPMDLGIRITGTLIPYPFGSRPFFI